MDRAIQKLRFSFFMVDQDFLMITLLLFPHFPKTDR